MTLAASGALSSNDINTELNRAGGAAWSLTGTVERALANVPSGSVILPNDFWGKSQILQTDSRTTAATSHATVDFGPDCTGRWIGVLAWHNDATSDPGDTPTATIGGVSANRIVQASTGSGDPSNFATGCALFTAQPTGTSGTVAVSWGGLSTTIVVFRTLIYNLSAAHNTEIDGGTTGGGDGRVGMNVPTNGLIIGAGGLGSVTTAMSWTNLTERGDETAGNRRSWAWDDFQPLATGDSRIIDMNPHQATSGYHSMIVATFALT